MKVRDLIDLLKDANPEATIVLDDGDNTPCDFVIHDGWVELNGGPIVTLRTIQPESNS